MMPIAISVMMQLILLFMMPLTMLFALWQLKILTSLEMLEIPEWGYLILGIFLLVLYLVWSAQTEMGTRPWRSGSSHPDRKDS